MIRSGSSAETIPSLPNARQKPFEQALIEERKVRLTKAMVLAAAKPCRWADCESRACSKVVQTTNKNARNRPYAKLTP